MKSIELTEEHKSKLLEMCNKLFPESNWEMSTQNGKCGMHSAKDIQIFVYQGSNPYNFPISIIHWFEFCINWLATSIYNKGKYNFNYITINQFRGYLCQEVDHPIDYLYEEFKKLK